MNRRWFVLAAAVAPTGAIAVAQVGLPVSPKLAAQTRRSWKRNEGRGVPEGAAGARNNPGEIVALEPSRGNLIARLKGSGRKPPLLLMAHTDVGGVERPSWSVDPFAGVRPGRRRRPVRRVSLPRRR